jgi:hypothetical protein
MSVSEARGVSKDRSAIPDRNGIAIKKNQTPNKIGRMDITAGVTIISRRQVIRLLIGFFFIMSSR